MLRVPAKVEDSSERTVFLRLRARELPERFSSMRVLRYTNAFDNEHGDDKAYELSEFKPFSLTNSYM